jgi:hypothetical protein
MKARKSRKMKDEEREENEDPIMNKRKQHGRKE